MPKQTGKTVRFRTETDQTYIPSHTCKVHDNNDMIVKEEITSEQHHKKDGTVGCRYAFLRLNSYMH